MLDDDDDNDDGNSGGLAWKPPPPSKPSTYPGPYVLDIVPLGQVVAQEDRLRGGLQRIEAVILRYLEGFLKRVKAGEVWL